MDDTARGIGDESEADAEVERRTSEIRRDIEQTRGDISETIGAIEEKLRPGNIVSSATEGLKNAATEKVRSMKQSAEQAYSRMRSGSNSRGLMGQIRENPIPSAMIGIGAAWLLMRSRSKNNDDRYRSQWSGSSDRSRFGNYRAMPESDAFETGVERDEYRGQTSSGFGDAASEMTSRAQEYARDVTTEARDRGGRVRSELQRMAGKNPLMVGAGALLLGSVVGLAIPETQRENEWLGETRDSVLDKAQEMARNTAARAQETAADLAGEAADRIIGAQSE